MFFESLRLDGLLSFAPGSDPINLRALNVVIGPNGSGKSNLIDAFELFKAAPSGLGGALRLGGGAEQWIWKGGGIQGATIEASLTRSNPHLSLRYELGFSSSGASISIDKEIFESVADSSGSTSRSYLRLVGPKVEIAAIASGDPKDPYGTQIFERHFLNGAEPVLAQRKDPLIFPDMAWLAGQFERTKMFREWTFGRFAKVRQPPAADLPSADLTLDSSNLALVLQNFDHRGRQLQEIGGYLKRFLPRFERFTFEVKGGLVSLHLHEEGIPTPFPMTRLSDGTLRFIGLLAVLLDPDPPPLICIEEPELGLHPDALDLVAELLVEASTRSQIVVTTHSDALVSGLTEQADSVLVCEYLGRGTVFSRVDSEKLKYWLDKYRLGEIWRAGKLGGNP